MRDFRDVEQPVESREHLDESAEVGDALYLPQIGFVELRGRGELLDDRDRLLGRGIVPRRDVDTTVVLDVDLHAGALDDAPNRLATRSDHIADLVDRNLDRDNPGRIGRNTGPRVLQRGAHALEDVQSPGACLFHRLPHDVSGDAAHLDVHLQRGDSIAGSGDLEVHVAVVVLCARDVAQHGVPSGRWVENQPHRDARDRRLERHPCVHQRQRSAAHRGHGRRPIRLQDVGNHPDRVGERVVTRHDREQTALGEVPVSDLPATRATQELDFPDRERRKVVVQHEPPVDLAVDHLDLLLVVSGAERRGHQRLRLAPREHRRPVGAGQQPDIAGDRPDLVERAAVEALTALEDLVTQHLFLERLEHALRVCAALGVVLG